MNNTTLILENLKKSYDGKTDVLTIEQLQIVKGEFVSFLGPSGSGKTTALMIIGGFEAPTGGDVILNGEPINSVVAHKRNMGIVFQNYALFPHMSVFKNVQYPLKMRRLPSSEAIKLVENALQMVGLEGYGNRFPAELSGGQQQRVALARALVFEPELVLLDEPLGALDKNLREQMQIELGRIHKETGATMIFVTHDQAEAMVMSDRIVVFSEGKIEQVGTPDEVYNRPTTRFVAEFIGDNNLLPAEYLDDGTVSIAALGEFKVQPNAVPVGPCLALIRPENIEVQKTRSESIADALVVTEKFNYGDMTILTGSICDTELRIKQPAMRVGHIKKGDKIHLSVPEAAIHLISDL